MNERSRKVHTNSQLNHSEPKTGKANKEANQMKGVTLFFMTTWTNLEDRM